MARFADISRLPNNVSPAIQIRAEQNLAEKNIAGDQLPQVGKRALVWKKIVVFFLSFFMFLLFTLTVKILL